MNDPNQKPHVTETPDSSYIKNVDVTHEASDVRIGGIAKFVVGLTVLTFAVCVLMWAMFRVLESGVKEPPRSPMALSEKESLPPEPRLQGAPGFAEQLEKSATPTEEEERAEPKGAGRGKPKDPLWEIKAVREQWNDVLEHGPIDQNGNRYGMPIEKAKAEILKQGLPARSQAADGRNQ